MTAHGEGVEVLLVSSTFNYGLPIFRKSARCF